jgi:hypothetical protein
MSQDKSLGETSRRDFVKLTGAALAGAAAWSASAKAQATAAPSASTAIKSAQNRVVIYPAPVGEVLSPDYTVEVNGKAVPVYAIASQWHDKKYSAAYFDFSGTVTVKIRPNLATLKTTVALDQLAIRPAKYGIQPAIADGEATFTTSTQFNISFEPTGQNSPLHLFSNPIEIGAPNQGDPNVVYFGPGIHKPTRIDLTAGQTLYIAGGAVVKSAVTSTGDNIRIMGRGILCGNDWQHSKGPTARMVWPTDGQNILIEDIIIRGAWNWTVAPSRCDQVLIRNLRICGSRCGNDDGIDPCNSSNVTIRNCFVHTDDDGIAVKGTANTGQNPKAAENILIEDCTFWIDFANGFRIGSESRATAMRNITARNIDIIHFPNRTQVAVFYLQPHDNMPMENLAFEDIRINGEQPLKLLQMTPLGHVETGRGLATPRPVARGGSPPLVVPGSGPYIHNVAFKDISVYGHHEGPENEPLIALDGVSTEHNIANVTFENVILHGQPITRDSPEIKIGEFVSQIEFKKNATVPSLPK